MRYEPMPPHKAAMFPALRERPKRGLYVATKGFIYSFVLGGMVGLAVILANALFRM